MDIFYKIVDAIKAYQASYSKSSAPAIGPNTLQELLEQFNHPKKEKTNLEVITDYTIKMSMFMFELDYLKDQPVTLYRGVQKYKDAQENIYFDWVPVAIRPEVSYCCYYKN